MHAALVEVLDPLGSKLGVAAADAVVLAERVEFPAIVPDGVVVLEALAPLLKVRETDTEVQGEGLGEPELEVLEVEEVEDRGDSEREGETVTENEGREDAVEVGGVEGETRRFDADTVVLNSVVTVNVGRDEAVSALRVGWVVSVKATVGVKLAEGQADADRVRDPLRVGADDADREKEALKLGAEGVAPDVGVALGLRDCKAGVGVCALTESVAKGWEAVGVRLCDPEAEGQADGVLVTEGDFEFRLVLVKRADPEACAVALLLLEGSDGVLAADTEAPTVTVPIVPFAPSVELKSGVTVTLLVAVVDMDTDSDGEVRGVYDTELVVVSLKDTVLAMLTLIVRDCVRVVRGEAEGDRVTLPQLLRLGEEEADLHKLAVKLRAFVGVAALDAV